MRTVSTELPQPGRRRLVALLLFAAAGFCTSTAVLAHPGHGAEISREQAVERATVEIERLTAQGKIDASWPMEARLSSARIVERAGSQEWELIFENAKAGAPNNRLYVFLSTTGEYLAANFSGS